LGPWVKANYCRAVIKSPRGTIKKDNFWLILVAFEYSAILPNYKWDTK
jgi:hypothetical protein